MLGSSTRIPYAGEPYPESRCGSRARRRRAARVILTALGCLLPASPALADGELYVRGAGFGHGVGMSQYGAYGYALHGFGYRAILAHYYSGTRLGTVDPSGTVTVLLGTGSASFTGASQAGPVKLKPGFTYEVRPLAGGDLRLVTLKGKRVATFTRLEVTGPGPLTVPGLGAYRGALEFRPAGGGRVQIINALALDDYVRGVVASEMPSNWPPAALEAQAVAARTYAITTDAGGSAFDQYPDTRSQVYGGVDAETPSSDAAVAATSGQVVTSGGRPVVTFFFSSSGGHTENVQDVFPGAAPDPWLRGVLDPFDDAAGNPHYRWRLAMRLTQAAAKLGSLVEGSLVGIEILTHGSSPRILTADVVGTRGFRRVTGVALEHRFGLQSTWAAFTAITTVAGRYLPPPPRVGVAELAMPLPLLKAVLHRAALRPDLSGRVFPAARGALIAVQEERGGRWRTHGYARLKDGGSYVVRLLRHGTYRIVYRGLVGPAVAA